MFDSFWSLWWMFTRNHRPLPHLKGNQIGAFPEKAEIDLWSSVFNLSSLYTFNLAWTDKANLSSQLGEKWPLLAVQWVCNRGNVIVGEQGQWIGRKVAYLFFFYSLFSILFFFFFSLKRIEKTHPNPFFIQKSGGSSLLKMVFGDLLLSLSLFTTGISDRSQRSADECQNTTDERTGKKSINMSYLYTVWPENTHTILRYFEYYIVQR